MTVLTGHDFTRADVNLGNWRTYPYSSWAFQNVTEIVPSAVIEGHGLTESAPVPFGAFSDMPVGTADGATVTLDRLLRDSKTNSFVVMRNGEIIAEWYAPTCDRLKPHLVFSVSKSITGILAAILEDQGLLSANDHVTRYVPEAAGSAYGDATLRHLLDMEVALDFNEDYLDKTGGYDRYRRATGWNPPKLGEPSPDLKSFLCTIPKSSGEHGQVHLYRSPNTDMVGIVLERAAGRRIPDLISELIWKPMGAHSDAFMTVDQIGASRTAAGISATPRDLVRFGDMVRLGGKGIVSELAIQDLWTKGSRESWRIGDQASHFEGGSYCSYWYETGQGELAAIGIHGQWIWIDPTTATVIVKQSSQELPTNDVLDHAIVGMLRAVSKHT
ncbi:MAG: serine hydrolase domain-containing protein [Rhizobiaceae bacterium]